MGLEQRVGAGLGALTVFCAGAARHSESPDDLAADDKRHASFDREGTLECQHAKTLSARRDGIGVPPSPLCASAVEDAKPTAPAAIASRTRLAIFAISSSVAVRSVASAPITQVRTEE